MDWSKQNSNNILWIRESELFYSKWCWEHFTYGDVDRICNCMASSSKIWIILSVFSSVKALVCFRFECERNVNVNRFHFAISWSSVCSIKTSLFAACTISSTPVYNFWIGWTGEETVTGKQISTLFSFSFCYSTLHAAILIYIWMALRGMGNCLAILCVTWCLYKFILNISDSWNLEASVLKWCPVLFIKCIQCLSRSESFCSFAINGTDSLNCVIFLCKFFPAFNSRIWQMETIDFQSWSIYEKPNNQTQA